MIRALPPIVSRAAGYGTRPAIIDRGRTFRYEDLDQASARIARHLLATKQGQTDLNDDRIAFVIAPGFEHVAVQWGIWRAGGIAVPLPLSYPPAELEYLIRDAEASLVIADTLNATVAAAVATACGSQFRTTTELLADVMADDSSAPRTDAFDPARRAMIVYTSGTTSRPKGVVSTHANIRAQIESLTQAWEWSSDDRTLLVLPLHHVHGIINVVGCALWSGAVLEMMPKFESESTWDRIASGQLTVFSAVPTMYHRLIQSWDAAGPDLRQRRSAGARAMRLMMSGSAALPRLVLDRWLQITGHTLLERYGMTEVGMALANPLKGERRPGFVGQPLPGVAARLVDGELQLRGANVFSEYWNQPDTTRQAFADGWFRTGDIAVVENGAYRLLGRSSVDIIKSGGDKISALEIEEVLRTHPAVGECAVVGVEDLEWGQRVCCAVELRQGCCLELDDLREWAKTRLAPHKIPKHLACVAQLPRNAMGKVVKPAVTTLFAPPAPPARQAP